jgi:hypothetical protein
MDGETHANLHLTRGTQFISGCAPGLVGVVDGTGNLDSDVQISIGDGLAADEDLPIVITNGSPQTLDPLAYIPVFYLTGTGQWEWDNATTFPVKPFVGGSGRLAYNNFNGSNWEQLEVGNQQYVLTHIFGTNDLAEPIIAIQGQSTYTTIGDARNGATTEINSLIFTGLPSQEFFPISTHIVQTADAYSNTIKARFRSTADGDDYVEWRFSGLSPATSTSYHNNLSGRADLNSHPASAISTDTTDFDGTGFLDTTNTNVQSALNEIDNYEKVRRSSSLDPTGYPYRSDTTLTWDHPTRTATLAPSVTQFDFWLKGKYYLTTSTYNKQITTTDGLHFIYFDDTLDLIDDEFPPTDQLLKGVVFTIIVYWNNTQGIAPHVGDERHGMVMDWSDHDYKHFVFGARYVSGLLLSNFTIGDGSLDSHSQLDCTDGKIKDEDIEHVIANGSPQTLSPIAQIPVFYRLGTDLWYRTEADNFPIIYSGKQGYVGGSVTTIYTGANGRPAYNQLVGGNWQLTEVDQGDFYLIHFFATNDIFYPIICILGINVYAKEKEAQDAAFTEIQTYSGMPFVEFTPIGTVICEASNTFGNSVNNRFIPTDMGGNYIDFRDTLTFKGISAALPSFYVSDYTPTLTNVTNVASSTTYLSGYSGISIEMMVRGEVSVTTSASGSTQFRLTLPVTSDLVDIFDLNGNGTESTGLFSVSIRADTTNNDALFTFIAPAASTYIITYLFSYRIQV